MPTPIRLSRHTAEVLYAVARGYQHGFDILDVTGLQSGTVYPILRRLEDAGFLRSSWERVQSARAEGRPPRRLYQVTAAGAETLRAALARYPAIAGGEPAGGPTPWPA